MDSEMQNFKLILIGHPRCGSRSISTFLSKVGLICGHEKLEKDGMVSWWHTGNYMGQKLFRNGKKEPKHFSSKIVGSYIRNPLDAIPSIVVENEHMDRDNNSFRFRSRLLMKWYGTDISKMGPLAAAATSYVLWNNKAREISELSSPIKVEQPELQEIMELAGIPATEEYEASLTNSEKLNTTEVKFGKKKRNFSKAEIIESVVDDRSVSASLEEYLTLYHEK